MSPSKNWLRTCRIGTPSKNVTDLFYRLGVSTITHDSLIDELREALFDNDVDRALHWADRIIDVTDELKHFIRESN